MGVMIPRFLGRGYIGMSHDPSKGPRNPWRDILQDLLFVKNQMVDRFKQRVGARLLKISPYTFTLRISRFIVTGVEETNQ